MTDNDVVIGVALTVHSAELTVFDDGRIWREGYISNGNYKVRGQWLNPTDNGKGYMRIKTVKTGSKRVHRLVAQAFLPDYSEDLTVDHINGDKSDNRVENLRMMSHCQNMRSYQKPRGGASKHRGVTRRSSGGSWVAQINVDSVISRLGSYATEEEAALAYNAAARRAGFSKEAMNDV